MSDKLRNLLRLLTTALSRLDLALTQPINEFVRDSSIQRFEFTFELFWKSLKAYAEESGLEAFSPRDSIRIAFQLGVIQESPEWFRMFGGPQSHQPYLQRSDGRFHLFPSPDIYTARASGARRAHTTSEGLALDSSSPLQREETCEIVPPIYYSLVAPIARQAAPMKEILQLYNNAYGLRKTDGLCSALVTHASRCRWANI